MLLGEPHMEESPKPNAQLAVTFRFDNFVLDVPRRMLLFGSEAKPLSEKIFQILLVLLESGGDVISKERFFNEVWPNETVSDQNLTQHICVLRNLLRNGDRDRSLILAVPGRGYRLGTIVERKVGLMMKGSCERCAEPIAPNSDAFICSYECTFCASCAESMERRCPNCGGELAPRPRR
jgi:uncharacterized protein